MKTGKSLVELAQTLEQIKNNSKDFVVPVEQMVATVNTNKVVEVEFQTSNGDLSTFAPNKHAHSQLATYAEIPKNYYDRIASENPTLLAQSINHGLTRVGQDSRMVRTTNNMMRAFLSSKYRRLDNYDLLDTVLPILLEKEFQVVSAEYTEQRMYLKVVTPRIQTEIKTGDVVQYGLVISSSDVGAGSLRVEPLIFRLVCSNGLISNTAMRRTHIGRDQSFNDVYELMSTDTLRLTDQAFWAQVRDVVTASMNPEKFEKEVSRLQLAATQQITNFNIPQVVDLSMKATGVTGEQTKQSIVSYLANGADGAGLTKWGLINGFTFAAQQSHVGYDESIEMERSAAKLLDATNSQWSKIATAE
jgi:hypothetical protein